MTRTPRVMRTLHHQAGKLADRTQMLSDYAGTLREHVSGRSLAYVSAGLALAGTGAAAAAGGFAGPAAGPAGPGGQHQPGYRTSFGQPAPGPT